MTTERSTPCSDESVWNWKKSPDDSKDYDAKLTRLPHTE